MADFSKIGKSNRSRGASYERKIAKLLTSSTGKKFKRTPRSGALLREGSIDGAFISGDVICEIPCIFSIECKNCRDINLESVLKSPATAPFVKYWCQCVYDARQSHKHPMMFAHLKSIRKDIAILCNGGSKIIDVIYPHMYVAMNTITTTIQIDNKKVTMHDIPSMNIYMADQLCHNLKGINIWHAADVQRKEKVLSPNL